MIRRSFLMLVGSALVLSACGFQLRGERNYAFKRLLITGAQPAMAARLKRVIEGGSDTVVVRSPDEADAVLSVSESRGQSTLTLNQYGSVEEYQINYSVNYSLTNKAGQLLLAPSVIALNRAMTYSTQYASAKSQEAEILYTDMQNDAVDQMLRRLSIVRTVEPASPNDVVPGVAPRAPLPPPPL